MNNKSKNIIDLAKPQNLSDQAYLLIRNDILRCELMPGESITEIQLTLRYETGKAPIRHALARLSQEGFIQSERRKGYHVTPITLADIQEVFQLRMLLEPQAARLAAGRLSEQQARTMRSTCETKYKPADRQSEEIFLIDNRMFHLTLAQASGNSRLVKWIGQLLDDGERILHLGLARKPNGHNLQQEHLDLLHALLANQPDQAAEMVKKHIESGLAMVISDVIKDPHLLDFRPKASE